MPSLFGADSSREKKIGHRRVDASGETTYKKVVWSCLDTCNILYYCLATLELVLVSALHLQTTSSALKGAIQLGIGYTVGNLSSKPERDVLMQDFYVVESIFFPRCVYRSWCLLMSVTYLFHVFIFFYSLCSSEGSNLTPAHHFPDFRFKTYAPVAFRYFRELFGIRPDDYLVRYLSFINIYSSKEQLYNIKMILCYS